MRRGGGLPVILTVVTVGLTAAIAAFGVIRADQPADLVNGRPAYCFPDERDPGCDPQLWKPAPSANTPADWKIRSLERFTLAMPPETVVVGNSEPERTEFQSRPFALWIKDARYPDDAFASHGELPDAPSGSLKGPPRVERLIIDGRFATLVSGDTGADRCQIELHFLIDGLDPRHDVTGLMCGDQETLPQMRQALLSLKFKPLPQRPAPPGKDDCRALPPSEVAQRVPPQKLAAVQTVLACPGHEKTDYSAMTKPVKHGEVCRYEDYDLDHGWRRRASALAFTTGPCPTDREAYTHLWSAVTDAQALRIRRVLAKTFRVAPERLTFFEIEPSHDFAPFRQNYSVTVVVDGRMSRTLALTFRLFQPPKIEPYRIYT